MSDRDTLENEGDEESLSSLKKAVKEAQDSIEKEKKDKELLIKALDELQLDMMITLQFVKALGEEIVLSQGNHTEKKILASALCNQTSKALRKWREKRFSPEYQNYRQLLRDARLDGGYGASDEF